MTLFTEGRLQAFERMIEAFLDHRLKLKPGDKYEVVDADHAK